MAVNRAELLKELGASNQEAASPDEATVASLAEALKQRPQQRD